MAKTLSQEEIDALFTAAKAPGPKVTKEKKITSYDLRASRKLHVQ
jgi:flagellar motor switch protein FliM